MRPPLLIVDFDDRFQREVRKWTRQRKAACQQRGWQVFGGPTVQLKDLSTRISRAREMFVPYAPPLKQWIAPVDDGIFKDVEYQYRSRRQRHLRTINKRFGQYPIQIQHVANRDVLFDAFRDLRRFGGTGPGIDGIRPLDITPQEFGPIAEALSDALIQGTWQPEETRRVLIDKVGKSEKRELRLPILLDRVVGKALHKTLGPIWEKIYLPNSFGFRPKRSTWGALAKVTAAVEKADRKVILAMDVKKAFDNVSIEQVLQKHVATLRYGKPLLSDDMIGLIGLVLRGANENRKVGIDQGGCYSPNAMNLLLHFVHDVPFHELGITPFWYRYADNLVYLCRDVHEGRLVQRQVEKLLSNSGLEINPDLQLANLAAGDSVEILGFTLALTGNAVRFSPLAGYQERLGQGLAEAWNSCEPIEEAHQRAKQWISQHGPALDSGSDDLVRTVTGLARQYGFDIDSQLEFIESSAIKRWRDCRSRARRSIRRSSVVA